MKNLKLYEAVGLLVGTVVGAGFLGIPFVVAKTGFPLGLLMILFIGSLLMVQYLMIAEMALRTGSQHQLAGYVGKYLGENWRNIVYVLVVLESYGAMLAYMVGEGQVLHTLFGWPSNLASFFYFIALAIIIFIGLKLIEKVDLLLTVIMASVVILLGLLGWSQVKFENFLGLNYSAMMPAYGVILFAFLAGGAVPEMKRVLKAEPGSLPKTVVIGTLIPIIIYILFTAVVLGVTGADTTEVATIGLGNALGPVMWIIGNALAAVTMTTSFLGISLSLKETFRWDMRKSRMEAWLLTILIPMILFTLGLHNFIKIISVVGALFGGLLGIILVLASWRAEKLGEREPEFIVPFKKFFGVLLIVMFVAGVVYCLWSF